MNDADNPRNIFQTHSLITELCKYLQRRALKIYRSYTQPAFRIPRENYAAAILSIQRADLRYDKTRANSISSLSRIAPDGFSYRGVYICNRMCVRGAILIARISQRVAD